MTATKKRKTRKKINWSFLKHIKPTVSHLILYVFLGIYIFVAIFSTNAISHLYEIGDATNANYALMGLFSFIGVSATVAIPFYFNKSKAENTIRENNVKYKMRFEMAKDVTKAYTKGDINSVGLNAMLALISEKDTSISVNGNGWGGSTVIEETTTYNATPFETPLANTLSNIATPIIDNLTNESEVAYG